ncbi:ankyrin repeat-containing protein [Colletotrichum sojae]|uniref:Ankyrin repeat-containing protein n=1 Tax=Colletotrichum sojae TaxID=2175907 RepID=A0A8H6JK37_9PEZI|nr:ankyrin repeat-containing protein [Colletotrichum sojae]
MANKLFGGLFGASGRTSGPGEGDDAPVMITRDDVSDFNEDNILPQSEETITELREWLRPTDYDDVGGEYRKHLDSHLPGTGGWLLSTKSYREWHDGQNDGLLWIRGIPGSGKSVFAANLTSQLANEGVPVLFFFFRQIIDANHSPAAAVRDWLDQILKFSPPLQLKLKCLVDRRAQLESLSFEDLWAHLRTALANIPRAYCVVDALDEMDRDERTEIFLESLVSLSQWRPAELKILITSRPVPSVEITLRTARALDIRLEEDEVDVDIATYVKDRLAPSSIPTEEHAAIQAAVPGRANGLFLYARLAMDAFLRPGADVQKVLRELPRDLNVMYTDLLREHVRRSGVPHETQLFIMQWVTHANRPLRLLELAEMLSITQQQPKDVQGLKETKELARAACGPLLEILPDETISVVHHSLTEFLNGSTREADAHYYPVLDFGATHNRLALACLKYLQSGCLEQMERPEISPMADEYRSPQTLLSQYWLATPFLRYACSNWHVHVRKAASAGFDQQEINDVLDTFLAGETLLRWAYLAQMLKKRHDDNPLLIAVLLGLTEFAKRLLEKENSAAEAEEERTKTRMAMAYAARGGHQDMVKLLLQHGKELNIPDEEGYTALIHAARGNHRNILVLLLEAGADPFVKKSPNALVYEDYGISPQITACEFACLKGHDEIAVAFLPYFKTAKQVTWAFGKAIEHGRHAVVQKILESGRVDVDADIVNYKNSAALFTACEERDPRMIKLLLDAGADPKRLKGMPGMLEATEDVGTSPLHALASARCYRSPKATPEATVECFELLLGAGANVHQRGVDDVTPLMISIDAVAARILLDAGADPNAADRHGQTLLHISNDVDVIQLLLEDAKADGKVETRPEGLTPLLAALNSSNVGKANLLLRHGAGAQEVDRDGNGAFHYFVGIDTPHRAPPEFFEERKLLVAGLLKYGANPGLRNRKGETPLHLLGRPLRGYRGRTSKHHDILEALLEAGASLEEKDDRGQVPLYRVTLECSRLNQYDECVKLCEKMTPPGGLRDVADAEGRNLLLGYVFAQGHDVRFVKYLVERGVDPTETDNGGNNLWHGALPFYCGVYFGSTTQKPTLFEEFIKMGVHPDQPSRAGRTALHVVSGFLPRPIHDLRCRSQSVKAGELTVFNYVLGLVENVDHHDEQGITALHIASTFSEWQTKRLLEAGANARSATHEGLTALHLAARSRKPNVVGILLDHLRGCSTAEETISVINARDALGRSPLYYACAAGRAATVRLLVQAGAEVWTEEAFERSPWHACARFEELDEKEDSDINYLLRRNRSDGGPDSGGVTVADDMPPRQPRDNGSWATADLPLGRLDEVLEELVGAGGHRAEVIDEAITSAARSGFDYTVASLLVTRTSLGFPEEYAADDPTAVACVERVLSNRGADAGEKKAKPEPCYAKQERNAYRAEGLARRRCPGLRKEVLLKKDCLEVDGKGKTLVNRLISDGNAADLASVLTRDIASKFEDADWCQQHEKKMYKTLQPLLFDACDCEEPNMDVLRVLVETVGVDVNCRRRAASGRPQSADANGGSILHALVRSQRWWHVSQALPYLVRMGADIEIKDNEGLTALGAALEGLGTIIFDRRVVEALLDLGADPNAVDGKGRSCLASVVEDLEIVRLLVRHGAVVTQSALISVIDGGNCETLEALLSGGTNPNVQQKTEEERRREEAGKPKDPFGAHANEGLTVPEMYPLHYVAHKFSQEKTDEAGREVCELMARILLDHGADPEAAYEKSTVIHEVLRLNRFPPLFLGLPSLNLEARDAAGRTLLLRLCSGGHRVIRFKNERDPSVPADPDPKLRAVMELIRRGADIRARDDAGNSTLHHLLIFLNEMISRSTPHFDREAFDYVVSVAPELVNQARADGWTPLQLALSCLYTRHGLFLELAEALLDAGADPLARGGFGNTPLHDLLAGRWEVSEGGIVVGLRRKLFDRLIAAGADINGRNSDGETPIFSFIRAGERLPLEEPKKPRGLIREMRDSNPTPIAEDASEWFERPLFEFWEHMGMDWKVFNDSKESLLHVIAADKGAVHFGKGPRNRKRFEYLMSKGLDELAEDGRHRTALDIASALDNNIVLGLFEKKKPGP